MRSGRSPKEYTMADEAENTQPEDQAQAPEASEDSQGSLGDETGAEEALDDASAIVEDVAAQADGGAEMSDSEAEALAAAMAAIGQVQDGTAGQVAEPEPAAMATDDGAAFESPEFGGGLSSSQRSDLELLSDVHMNVRIELGRTRMYVEDVLRLGDGAVVELDKLAGDPVDVFVNDRKVARGEVLVLNDNFCVRISEILDIRDS